MPSRTLRQVGPYPVYQRTKMPLITSGCSRQVGSQSLPDSGEGLEMNYLPVSDVLSASHM